ncbi:MAG: NAD(P)/FAD-dependent oxidoreductase [Leadbetterella sp.]
MVQDIQLRLPPDIALDSQKLEDYLLNMYPDYQADDFSYYISRKSIDARQRQVYINLNVQLGGKNQVYYEGISTFDHEPKKFQKSIIIVGAGPAGLFAALRAIELGIKPIVIERGTDVQARRRDIAAINKEHIVNPNSNYCFGEGGAGTYSDGKLYTRSKKRGDIRRVLDILVTYGATPQILVDAHPHIGTNKLPLVVKNLREAILKGGGEVIFNCIITDLILENKEIKGCVSSDGRSFMADGLVLATGHSARDVFELLHKKDVEIAAKPFAIGVRVEHEQSFVDACQYSTPERGLLPAASYSLVAQSQSGGMKRGVFSFCMCPGGFIVPSSTEQRELVVNGMSPSRRDSRFSNSGIVVAIEKPDWKNFENEGALAALRFQQDIEKKAFTIISKQLNSEITQVMPAQGVEDFLNKKNSKSLRDTSYQPGLLSYDMREILPSFISQSLTDGFVDFNKKMRGYIHGQMIGIESRTSSPVRIPRSPDTLEHTQIRRLFPCGEGAGYAGGIVSAAMDGERCVEAFAKLYALHGI